MTEEERREMMRSNYAAQMEMLGHDTSGNPLDIVRVVRCKDCKHYFFAANRVLLEQAWVCGKYGFDKDKDWFCADGERMDK